MTYQAKINHTFYIHKTNKNTISHNILYFLLKKVNNNYRCQYLTLQNIIKPIFIMFLATVQNHFRNYLPINT
jgi:hypothetical protein